ncbi:MAG TPA: PEP-CTERM sorting domain-containing protein [Myxococcota bacterium]|nr:PEP-CTERM sorting domain-containing protein [Myxococcota bacterium]
MLNWQLFTVNFTATGSTTNLTFFNGDASNNFETPLDNVSVNAVPEPSTLTYLLGIGAVGLVIGATRRPRQRKAAKCSSAETKTLGQCWASR